MKKNSLKRIPQVSFVLALSFIALIACSSDSVDDEITEDTANNDDADDDSEEVVTELHAAYAAFNSDAVTVYLDGSEIVIETTGLPNHETIYWGEGNALYREEPDVNKTLSIMSSKIIQQLFV